MSQLRHRASLPPLRLAPKLAALTKSRPHSVRSGDQAREKIAGDGQRGGDSGGIVRDRSSGRHGSVPGGAARPPIQVCTAETFGKSAQASELESFSLLPQRCPSTMRRS
eukprot:scaffold145_cov261-Pinguiococcus_pyrenoidosus.AAC.28